MADSIIPIMSGGARVPPHSMEAEAAVLSAVILDPQVLDRVQDILRPEHFYSKANHRIYEAICELRLGGLAVDIVLVSNWLRDRNRLGEIGGTPYLAMIADATPAVANVEEHAQVIVIKWRTRQMIAICHSAVARGYGAVENAQELLEEVEQQIADVTHQGQRVREEAVRTIASRVITRIANARERGEAITGVPTGFPALDRLTGGLFDSDLIVVAARPGLGKAQPLDAKVLTPTGWRQMGDLALGDLVIGKNGKPTRVTGVFERGAREVFEVGLDDGGKTECCAEHLWNTRTRSERRRNLPGATRSLTEIMGTLQRAADGGLNHSIEFVEPVEYEAEPLPLDPYLVGAFLGDGCATDSSVVISNPEPDIQARIIARLPRGDEGHVTDAGKTIRVRHVPGATRNETRRALAALGLAGKRAEEKFIPPCYLRGTVAERVALLRGLCDTDGYVVNGNKGIEYSTASARLRDDIHELVGSLGGRLSSVTRPGRYLKDGVRHECQASHRMVIYFPGGLCPVSSVKHLRKWDPSPHRLRERFIKSVRSVGLKQTRCIRVENEDGLYVTDDFIVTHNTAWCQSLACNVARPKHRANGTTELGHAVLFCTLEQPREQLVMRIASHEAEFDASLWRRPRLSEEDWQKVSGSFAKLEHLPLYIDDTPALTLLDLRAKIRRLKRQIERQMADGTALVPSKPLKLVIVDYLQLMKGMRERGDTREREVASLSAGLKVLAKQERITIVAVSQLNRELEKNKDKRPTLKDLRESGAIEQDADNVYFLYRESYYDRNTTERLAAELIISKQRNGPDGTIELIFRKEYTRYYSIAGDNAEFDDWHDNYDG